MRISKRIKYLLKIFQLILILITFSSLIYSISFNELINSYDFSYKNSNINVKIINVSNIEDILDINLNINTNSNFYQINSLLYGLNKTKNSISKITYKKLNGGDNIFNLKFNTTNLDKGNYKLFLEIKNNNNILYKNYSIFNFSKLNKTKLNILSYNINNKNQIVITFNNSLNEYKNAKVQIQNNNFLLGDILNNKLLINMSNKNIGNNDNLTIKKIILIKNNQSEIFKVNKNILIKSFNSFSKFTNEISIKKIDSNNNGLYEGIKFNVDLNLNESANYKLFGIITDLYDNKIVSINSLSKKYGVGLNTIILNLKSSDILFSKNNGPYKLKFLTLYKDNKFIEGKIINYDLENLSSYNFENRNLSDLKISNFNYNKSSGFANLNISNDGFSDAILFNLKIFDYNFNTILDKNIDSILSNTTLNLVYNLSKNLSKLYIYVDYLNVVEELSEKNNLYLWPEFNFRYKFENFTQLINTNKSLSKFGLIREFLIDSNMKNKIIELNYDFKNLGTSIDFKNFNTSRNLNKKIKIDLYEKTNGYLNILGVNTSYNFSNATVVMKYNSSEITNEDNIKLYYCAKYNFENRSCKISFIDITNRSTINKTSKEISFIAKGFSAYAFKEYFPNNNNNNQNSNSETSSGGGGGGGGSSNIDNSNLILEFVNNNKNKTNSSNNLSDNIILNKTNFKKDIKLINKNISNENLLNQNSSKTLLDKSIESIKKIKGLTGNIIVENDFSWEKIVIGFLLLGIVIGGFGFFFS